MNAEELFEIMDNDFDKYPLPLEFDPHEELKELNRREDRLKAIAKRYVRIHSSKPAQP